MSTAHRPTWNAKKGGGGLRDGVTAPPTLQHSSKDQPAHKRLKYNSDLCCEDVDEYADFFSVGGVDGDGVDGESGQMIGDGDSSEPEEDQDTQEQQELEQEEDSTDDSTEEESDEEELLRELEKIRAERAASKPPHPPHQQPLVDGLVQRRWEEEGVVFKRKPAAQSAPEKRRFVNDTVRSEQHREFMNKYVK